ncbi:MAG: restriction endonuclease subunit S [Leptospiraceae bacterium]|nr:restriction endonuclease subunit S [Leptospiraceae bacterium]MDW7974971.1 restriction endonuclease subunit S [Leptospiraceae bacterium]
MYYLLLEGRRLILKNSKNGIPFLRVQNITPEGLNLQDIKYINIATHNGMLKRSQVKEFDLITKITGVGRMAVSAVAPKEFEGNINQHLVVIKTKNEQTSKTLATFLNSDIGEKLAKKRSTGGTRPALDYTALKSIPVIFKPEIVEIMESAYKQKKEKEAEAEKLLASIDDYVLEMLGIKMPEIKDKMCFAVDSEEVKGKRIDAYYHKPNLKEIKKAFEKGKYKTVKVKDFLAKIKKGIEVGSKSYVSDGVPFVRVVDIDDYKINIDTDKKISFDLYKNLKDEYNPKKGELLYSKDGTIGLCVVVEKEMDFIISGGILRLEVKKNINNFYLKTVLSSKILKLLAEAESIGQIIKHLLPEKFLNLPIPLPPLEIQNQIAEEVKNRIEKAKKLKEEAKNIVEMAKKQVEEIILK